MNSSRLNVSFTSVACGLLAALAAAQTPFVSPHVDLAGDALVGAATGDQQNAAIARGASGYLVAWSDRRAQLSTQYNMTGLAESGYDIWARQLDPNGTPVGVVPFVLDVAAGDDTSPRVSWNGSNWLVTWVAEAPYGSIYASAIVGMRINPSGQKLDLQPIVIYGYPSSDVASYDLESDGSSWVVVAQGSSGGSSGVGAVRLSAAGVVLDPTPVPLLSSTSLIAVDLAWAQGAFLMVWSDWKTATGYDVVGLRFDSNLVKLDPSPKVLAATSFNDGGARVASNGSQFFVAFERSVATTYQADIQGVRVTPAGTVLDPTPIAITGNLPYGNAMSPAAAWDGTLWYVSWTYSGLTLARVAANGSVIDFGGFPFDPAAPYNTQVGAALAGDGSGGVQLAWTDTRAGSYEGADLYGAQVDGPGAIGPQSVLSTGASAQLDVDFATDGTGYVAVYRSETSGNRRILAARLDAQGTALDPEPLEVAVGLHEYTPSVAWTNGTWLFVWTRMFDVQNGVAVYARRMDANGAWLDANPILVGQGYDPEVAGQGDEFLVAWTRPVFYPEQSFVNYVRVRASDGAVLGSPVVITSNYARVPDVCVLGGRYAIVYQRNWSHDNPWADVFGAFVDFDGTLGPTFGAGSGPTTYNYMPRIASTGAQALIVWQSGPGYGYARRAFARRMDASGTLLGSSFQIVTGVPAQQVRPVATWDGNQWLVAFEDTRAVNGSLLDQRTDVFAARVDPNGVVLDPTGFALENDLVPEHGAGVIGLGGGRSLFAASKLRTEAPLAAYRISVRTIDGVCPTPSVYCTPKISSGGCVPSMFALGTPSLGHPSQFTLGATALETGKSALVFFGTTGPNGVPFQGGTLCVLPPHYRLAVASSGGAGACQGSVGYTLADLLAHGQGGDLVTLGATIHAQAWFRDPASPSTTGLSDGITFSVCP